MSKYGNKRTEIDGISFASQREANRYGELKLLQRAGEIRELETQVRFPFVINEQHVCSYVADFTYSEKVPWQERGYEDRSPQAWRPVVEDCKGFRTDVYGLKKKLLKAIFGIDIRET